MAFNANNVRMLSQIMICNNVSVHMYRRYMVVDTVLPWLMQVNSILVCIQTCTRYSDIKSEQFIGIYNLQNNLFNVSFSCLSNKAHL